MACCLFNLNLTRQIICSSRYTHLTSQWKKETKNFKQDNFNWEGYLLGSNPLKPVWLHCQIWLNLQIKKNDVHFKCWMFVVYLDQRLSATNSKHWSKSAFFTFFNILERFWCKNDTLFPNSGQHKINVLASYKTSLLNHFCVNQHLGIRQKYASFLIIFSSKSSKNVWKKQISTNIWGGQHPNTGQNIQQWLRKRF